MVRWKNRSIDELNNTELKTALSELVGMQLGQKSTPESMIVDGYWLGLATGLFAAFAGLAVAALIM
ncbi:hypothetical protein [Salaquimonas pukyongi]|uniref:hypothetical protein n=1 Tax=Salaquimonas pukyongi TaxID=2712698 RepID=UPI00096BCC02|nr:hypothetical protein [Salaquimonas pukyongi]